MQSTNSRILWYARQLLWAVPLAALLIWQRANLWQALAQLFIGMLVALAALPLMKLYEKKLPPGIAASLAMTSLTVLLLLFLLLLAPPLVSQGKQILAMLPGIYAAVNDWVKSAQDWLAQNGVVVDEGMKASVFSKGETLLSGAAAAVAGWVKIAAGNVSKWLVAPVFAYYFLRDRTQIGHWLLMLAPAGERALIVRMLREMKRETAGYLRGQLLISAVVGGLTAIGLLFCGVPAWLLLGVSMGILELIPYIGPFLGGVLVFFFSLQNGLSGLLWAMGVVLVVQQLEGGMLSPQLMSDATRLHPVAVLLCVMLGGAAGGVAGILLAIPLLLCARAALRVIAVNRSEGLYERGGGGA